VARPFTPAVEVARRVASAAQEVPEVLGLHGGTYGEIATYGEGGPVRGVRVRRAPEPGLRLHIIVRFGARLDEVADSVRTRVRDEAARHWPVFTDARVDVHVADVDLGDAAATRPAPSGEVPGAEVPPRRGSTLLTP
jgi:uncharacterized alkaline shock family protein YloU